MSINKSLRAMNSPRKETRKIYLLALALVSIFAVAAFLAVPSDIVEMASAAKQDRSEKERVDAMLDFALDFGSIADQAAFGSEVRAQNLRGPAPSNRRNSKGVKRSAKDLEDAMSAIRQLPCTNFKDTELGGKAFTPGVYCVSSATLSGQMTLDGAGDQNGRFVIRVEGDFNAKAGSSVVLLNGAQAYNVYLVSEESVSIGAGSQFLGNIVAKRDIRVGADSTVEGKVYSAQGKVDLSNAVAGPGTGFLEICKNVTFTDARLAGRIYTFTVGGQTIQVPVGACSAPIQVTAGPVTVTEQLRANSRLFGVVGRDAAGNPIPVTNVNQFTQQATINVPVGNSGNQVVIEFQNVFGAIGVLEICKRAIGPDVTGFFEFFVFGNPGITYTVPVGQCSPPIAVNTPLFVGEPGDPYTYVTEVGEPGFTLVDIATIPIDRLIAETYGIGVNNTFPALTTFTNPGGGVAQIRLREVTGVTLNDPIPPGFQTTVNFFNQANPGQLKVCKIAGPGIPINTVFRFEVAGTRVTADSTLPVFETEPFTTFVDVPAGPAGQGGFCQFVNARFVIGTEIRVTETGLAPGSPPVPNLADGQIYVSRIRTVPFNPIQVQLGPIPPPPVAPANLPFVRLLARAQTVEAEFVNFLFRPTVLKICKVGASGSFTFTVTVADSTLFPNFGTSTVEVQTGQCQFVNGPFPPTNTTPPIGTFPVGVPLIITELQTSPSSQIVSVTSPTSSVPGGTVIGAVNTTDTPVGGVPARSAVVTLGGSSPFSPNFINEVLFTNGGPTTNPTAGPANVAGRVLTAKGAGISGASVSATDAEGKVYMARTNAFGFYTMWELPSGNTYVFKVTSRRYTFAPRVVNLTDELSGFDFVAEQ